ncbi:hypothetical protein ACO0LC_10320 [Undibacterium sp. JH2W]|uniref:hypothetical protein n=1 Tax=Undibacterium sp. JH2W TaxID=3413037 RepID=UPI003BF2B613
MKDIFCALLFLYAIISPATVIAEEGDKAVVQFETYAQVEIGRVANLPEQLVVAGEIVSIKKRHGGWLWIVRESAYPDGWIAMTKVIFQQQFTAVPRWEDVSRIEVSGGDYEAHYKLHLDGSFEVRETAMRGEDEYYLVKRHGHLLRHGKLVWARVGDEPLKSSRIFLLHEGDRSCQLLDNIAGCEAH